MNRVTLRRGEATKERVAAALDELQINPGEDFCIVPAAAFVENGVSVNGASRRGDPDTAKEAAKLSRETHAGKVLIELSRADGTTGELAKRLGWARDSVSPRVGALKRIGLVEDTPERHGRQRVVRLTPAGQAKAAGWMTRLF